METGSPPELASHARTALDATNRLHSHAEKAREIERVIDGERDRIEHSIQEIVADGLRDQRDPPDGVSIRDTTADVAVRVTAGFEAAVSNAIENAMAHNPAPVSIELTTEVGQETVELLIVDDGFGISAAETAVLDAEEETSLAHGSGVGLWVMKWHVENSGGQLAVSGDYSGTTIRMTLSRA